MCLTLNCVCFLLVIAQNRVLVSLPTTTITTTNFISPVRNALDKVQANISYTYLRVQHLGITKTAKKLQGAILNKVNQMFAALFYTALTKTNGRAILV